MLKRAWEDMLWPVVLGVVNVALLDVGKVEPGEAPNISVDLEVCGAVNEVIQENVLGTKEKFE